MSSTTKAGTAPTTLRRFKSDARGSVALMFGLALIPFLGLAGAAVDYTNASTQRSKLAAASDAAALAAAKATNMSKADRDKMARAVFDASIGDTKYQSLSFAVNDIASGVRVDVTGVINTNFMGLIGIPTSQLDVYSEVMRGDGVVEVALVLDNTGSMVNDMAGMKTASKNFINTLFASSPSADSLKMGIVPYVASVNPGRLNLGMSSVDSTAESPYHALMLRSRGIGAMVGCNPNPFPPSGGGGGGDGGGGGGGGGDPDPGPGTGGDGAWIQDALKKLAFVGQELFGVKSAAALGETPNTKLPLSGTWVTPGAPYVSAGTKAFQPTGFQYWGPCWLGNPDKINNLDLFDRIPEAKWKGCVEARPDPYDVTDDAPTSDPRTKFVPYFWPDEEGKKGEVVKQSVNNYMDDGTLPSGWTMDWPGAWEKTFNIIKYNGANKADMSDTSGPNKGCPDELMRLSNDKSALTNKIDTLKTIGNVGGTISSEGVAWGWRVVTPKAPFADGKPYGKAKKFIVVMSDGQNEIGGSDPGGPVMSHYTSYGYLRAGRFPKENYQVAGKYLDERFALVCENAKKAGVTVMTVYFRDNNSSAKNMMRKCATSEKYFYEAANAAALDTAFQAIAAEIGKLRITK